MNYFKTKDGQILPFIQVIRTSETGLPLYPLRVYFLNGSIDLRQEDAEMFLEYYLDWLN